MVIYMSETFSSLKQEMRKGDPDTHPLLRSVRPYRQKFCKLARQSSGISQEELCAKLNEHIGILKLKDLPSFDRFYPITPDLIDKLENNITHIIEYNPYNQGFLGIGVMGTPTKDIARVIAEICDVSPAYRKFEDWSFEYEFGKPLREMMRQH